MQDTIKKTFLVAFLLCLICSVLVATAAVVFKPKQDQNKLRNKQLNILYAAGLAEPGRALSSKQIDALFTGKIKSRIVELSTGKFINTIPINTFDQYKAAKNQKTSVNLSSREDIAGIGRKALYAKVYIIEDVNRRIEKLVLPVHGYGLWSTLYGFISLESDFNTIAGLGFYQHAETPGLGGEVDNPLWKAQWPGKKVYQNHQPEIALVKSKSDNPNVAAYQVDALSGATLTSVGVNNLLRFWLGEQGFLPLIDRLKAEVK